MKKFAKKLSCLSLIALMIAQPVLAQGWDITNTGQPTTEADFTVSEGTWMTVAVSPDDKTMVFDMLGDIYSMPITGGAATPILDGMAMQRSPRFSADGKHLLYISDISGSDNVWMSDPDGKNARQITHETTSQMSGPAFGPQGTIAAARMDATVPHLHNSELRLYDPAGGAGRLLAKPTSGENVHEVAFSPDGRYAYYTEKVTGPSASHVYIDGNHMNYAIMRRDLQSGQTEELIKGFGGATTPILSRDGKKIAFVRRIKAKTVLFTYDIASGEQQPVFDGLSRDDQADFIGQGLYYPQYDWLPDNRHIVIWAGGKLHKVDTRTGIATDIPFTVHVRQQLTTPLRIQHDVAPATVKARIIRQLAVSPDGRTTLFQALGSLWKQTTGKPVRLTAGALPQFEPTYAPDGKSIAFVEWNDETGSALKVSNASGVHTLLATSGVIREPSFSPDGKTIVYKIDNGDHCLGGHSIQQGLYLISVAGGETRYITTMGEHPIFSPDGQRLYFVRDDYIGDDRIATLSSVDLNGGTPRDHAKTLNADSSELRVSPDLKWIAFKDHQQYYLTAFSALGSAMTVSAADAGAPVKKLSADGGYSLIWSADSKSMHWALGAEIQSATTSGQPLTPLDIDLEVPGDRPTGALAFTDARIITMKGDEVIEHGIVVVEGNRITAVGPAAAITIPAGAKQIDASGKTIMPGLIDTHGHIDVCYYSSAGLTAQKQPPRYAELAYGVTTNYDPYTSELPTYELEEMTKAGLTVGPRAIDSGMVAYGRTNKSDAVYVPITSFADAQTFMKRKNALGGLTVKSYRQPMRAQRQMLIKAGREAGVMLDVEGESHLFNNITMIQDGHFNIQHNMPVATYYDDIVQLWAHSQVAHSPTMMALFGEMMGENYFYQTTDTWKDPKARAFIQTTTSGYSPLATPYGAPPYVRNMTTVNVADELWDIGFRSVSRSMKKLDDAGVLVTTGSHGQIPGFGLHGEMWMLAEGGMSNQHVLRAATLNGAKSLGIDGQVGSIEPGKLADFIVLDANPLDNIRNSNSVRYTLINGHMYDSNTMNEIGNVNKSRTKFFWEVGRDYNGIEWKKAWAHD
jgi:Tol biopolymer transport system component